MSDQPTPRAPDTANRALAAELAKAHDRIVALEYLLRAARRLRQPTAPAERPPRNYSEQRALLDASLSNIPPFPGGEPTAADDAARCTICRNHVSLDRPYHVTRDCPDREPTAPDDEHVMSWRFTSHMQASPAPDDIQREIAEALDAVPEADDCVHLRHGFCSECAAAAVMDVLRRNGMTAHPKHSPPCCVYSPSGVSR